MALDYTFERRIELQREEAMEDGIKIGKEEGLTACIETCQEFGGTRDQATRQIIKKFSLTEKEASEYVKKAWRVCESFSVNRDINGLL
jgi:flagellar biosynthesis/type III secretory pathway protein FliH